MEMAHAQPVQADKETPKALDIREKGGPKDGQTQYSDRRLFMQLQAFGDCGDPKSLGPALAEAGIEAVVYADLADPKGAAVLAVSEDPNLFVTKLREAFNRWPFDNLSLKPEYTMIGRTYSLGYEPNLEDWLLRRPKRVIMDRQWPWAVWYPLRRTGAFAKLSHQEQGQMLKEHGIIGRSFGDAELAQDIRLACAGMDKNDNDFVIGLIGKDLYPLSALVQSMRATRQTSEFIQSMGPFFVGRALWQSELSKSS
ncbi:MAG: chlorite dismutase family protein [Elusimicrobia bacterium]|nr:chlorite dismutase family protein [Elusimicrobiota bacterium]